MGLGSEKGYRPCLCRRSYWLLSYYSDFCCLCAATYLLLNILFISLCLIGIVQGLGVLYTPNGSCILLQTATTYEERSDS